MKVLVDGKPERVEKVATAEIYREVVGRQFEHGRSVIGVLVDGIEAGPEEQQRILAGGEADYDTIEFRTMPTAELVSGTLDELLRQFGPLREATRAAAAAMAEGDHRKALEAFRPSLDRWLTVCDTVQKACLLLRQDVAVPLGGSSVLAAHERIAGVLAAIQGCFEKTDWARFEEVVSKDLPAAADEWEKIVKALCEL